MKILNLESAQIYNKIAQNSIFLVLLNFFLHSAKNFTRTAFTAFVTNISCSFELEAIKALNHLFLRSCQSVNLSTYHLLACQLLYMQLTCVITTFDLLQDINTTINRVTIYKYKNTILEAADILLRANTTCQEMSLALS